MLSYRVLLLKFEEKTFDLNIIQMYTTSISSDEDIDKVFEDLGQAKAQCLLPSWMILTKSKREERRKCGRTSWTGHQKHARKETSWLVS